MTHSRALHAAIFAAVACAQDASKDIPKNVTYVCSGERLYVESCNIRDLSDTSTCQVAHPDRPKHNGFLAYTTDTRGTLRKLLPTCQQPSAKEIAAEEAFRKKQQAILDANTPKANAQPAAPAQPSAVNFSQAQKPKTPEQRALARCITSGRLPASCTGNSLLGAFSEMISSVLPAVAKEPTPGLAMSGVYQGAGNWRIDFQGTDPDVLVNCSFLSPDGRKYTVDLKNNLAVITIDTTPRPLVLTFKADGTMTGPGPVTIDGVVASGTSGGGPYKDEHGRFLTDNEAAGHAGPVYDATGNRVLNPSTVHANFVPRKATCPALNLSNKGGVGIQTMQTDLLKTVFGGQKGAPTPAGIRMRGIFAASTGFSVQFFPESAILGCGPDAARAYPYKVVADGTKSFITIDAPDHPLTLAFRPDGSLDPGSGSYQVHGRIVTGQNENDDFTFAPNEQTCNLFALAPSKQIPSSGGIAATAVATLSMPNAPLGNAQLTIVSGFASAPNPLAGRPYVLLRDSYGNALAKGGVTVPPGMSPYKYAGTACGNRTPDCAKINDAIKANAASAVRADANGGGTFPGVLPGTYYLMISARYNNQSLIWGQAVQLKPGANSLTLDQNNAAPLN